MRNFASIVVAGWIVCAVVSTTFAAELLRVMPEGKQPEDTRLRKSRDYNATTEWNPTFDTKEAWEKRAREVREQILVSNGLWPLPEKTPLKPVIHGKIERDDYTIEKVYFQSFPGHYVTGNLYRPKKAPPAGEKYPVVLCPHGHWNNGRLYEAKDPEVKKLIASGAEKTEAGAKYPLQARPAMLARLGCVAFFYDMVGYADSTAIKHREGFRDAAAEANLTNFMGLQTWNSIRAIDFVLSLDNVDPNRIAVTGASGGGTQSMILGAIDPRVSLIVPAVMVSQNMQGGCVCENASLMRVGTNNIEFAAAFAPKPQGMTGADDWTKDIETAGYPQIKKVYDLFGAGSMVEAWYRPFPHNYNQVSRELMYNFLNKHFKLGVEGVIAEKPFEPVPPKDLSVWNQQHPHPNDAADAEAVKLAWKAANDRALNHMVASDPNEYRRVIATAARVMIGDQWPVTAQSSHAALKTTRAEGYSIETGLLTRPNDGSFAHVDRKKASSGAPEGPEAKVPPQPSIPYALLTPEGWNGETVVWIHPAGKLTLCGDDARPIGPIQRILDAKYAVLCGDLFATGEYLPEGKAAADLRPVDEKFPGYVFGYNRSILAERVSDILTLVAYAKSKNSKFVHQVALDGAGVWGLLAKGIAGEAILRSAIDLGGFDFDSVKSATEENFLPGAQKYGGVATFISMSRVGETALYRMPEGMDLTSLPLPSRGVRIGRGRMVDWVIREGTVDAEEVPRR